MIRIRDLRRATESFVVSFCVVLATMAVIVSAREVPDDHERLRRRVTELELEQAALERWAVKELRPWVIKETKRITQTIPTQIPAPSVSPLPPPPVVIASPAPLPSVSVEPSPPLPTLVPTPTPEPSPTCVPVVDLCIGAEQPSGG